MLLTKVTLSNYGVYRDKNEFDFRCDLEKPVILCGGTNGEPGELTSQAIARSCVRFARMLSGEVVL